MGGVEPGKSTSDRNIDLIDPPRRFLTSRWPQSVSKVASKSLPTDKNGYETTLQASIYRFLSVRRALSKADFQPLCLPIFIIHMKSWFRIGFYHTNSPSIVFVSMPIVFWTLLIFKVKKVDFVCVFIDWIGPRFEHISTMYCKYRVPKQLPSRIYRYLSIGKALRKAHFYSPLWFSMVFQI